MNQLNNFINITAPVPVSAQIQQDTDTEEAIAAGKHRRQCFAIMDNLREAFIVAEIPVAAVWAYFLIDRDLKPTESRTAFSARDWAITAARLFQAQLSERSFQELCTDIRRVAATRVRVLPLGCAPEKQVWEGLYYEGLPARCQRYADATGHLVRLHMAGLHVDFDPAELRIPAGTVDGKDLNAALPACCPPSEKSTERWRHRWISTEAAVRYLKRFGGKVYFEADKGIPWGLLFSAQGDSLAYVRGWAAYQKAVGEANRVMSALGIDIPALCPPSEISTKRLAGLGHHCHKKDAAVFFDNRRSARGPAVGYLNKSSYGWWVKVVSDKFVFTAKIPSGLSWGDAIDFVFAHANWR